jgi:hypothetical protein
VGVRVSLSSTITTTGEVELFPVPDPHIAFVRRLNISNGATELATVQLIFYNGDARKPVLTLKVPSGQTLTLIEDNLPVEACPTRIALSTDQQPISVDYSVELD